MHHEISWQVELTIKAEQFDAFCALTHEMIESTKLEARMAARFSSTNVTPTLKPQFYTCGVFVNSSAKPSGAW
jgi:hypothetical protein